MENMRRHTLESNVTLLLIFKFMNLFEEERRPVRRQINAFAAFAYVFIFSYDIMGNNVVLMGEKRSRLRHNSYRIKHLSGLSNG